MRTVQRLEARSRLDVSSIVVWLASAMAISGCWLDTKPLAETPVRRRVVIEDVLSQVRPAADAQEGTTVPKIRTPHLKTILTVPDDETALYVDARISRADFDDPRKIGPAEFIVKGDGRILLRRELMSETVHGAFEAEIPLSRFRGRQVEIDLLIENRDPEKTKAYWWQILHQRVYPTPRRQAADGPNLLFVLVDTLRADHMSLYGYERPTTPFLEELAAESVVFERAIAPASWTLPSVASLLTGLYPPRHGSVNGEGLYYGHRTLAERLQEEGFTTVGISANPLIGPRHGFAQGFETFEHVPWQPAARVNDRFQRWLRDKDGVQWFAYLHYIDPHDPYAPPEDFEGTFADEDYDGLFVDPESLNELYLTVNFGLPAAHAFDSSDIEYLRDTYDDEIRYWDSQFRELVELLRSRGELRRTIIVVVSDHGEEFVEHSMFKHGHQLYDESLHVPLVIYAPHVLEPGRRTNPVELLGIHQTILQLLRVAGETTNVTPLLHDAGRSSLLFSHTRVPVAPDRPAERYGIAAVELEGWKLIEHLNSGKVELYDLTSDPGETVERSDQESEQVAKYRQLLHDWLEKQRITSHEDTPPAVDEDAIRRLRALGYVQ